MHTQYAVRVSEIILIKGPNLEYKFTMSIKNGIKGNPKHPN